MPVDQSLDDAIGAAAVELEELANKQRAKDGKPPVETPTLTETEEEETPESEEEETETPEEETEETDEGEEVNEDLKKEASEAIILYNALKDPKQRGAVIAALAHEAGILTNKPPETKKEEKQQEKDIRALVEEALGPELKFLAPKLGEVFEKVVQKQTEVLEQRDQEALQEKIVNESNTALAQLAKETNGQSRQFEKKMSELADQFLPGPNMSATQYIRHLYTLASAGSKAPQVKANVEDRQRRNFNDSASRLSAKGKATKEEPVDLNKKRSLTESIDLAVKELQRKGQKIGR